MFRGGFRDGEAVGGAAPAASRKPHDRSTSIQPPFGLHRWLYPTATSPTSGLFKTRGTVQRRMSESSRGCAQTTSVLGRTPRSNCSGLAAAKWQSQVLHLALSKSRGFGRPVTACLDDLWNVFMLPTADASSGSRSAVLDGGEAANDRLPGRASILVALTVVDEVALVEAAFTPASPFWPRRRVSLQTTPCASMASATLTKPAMFAPST